MLWMCLEVREGWRKVDVVGVERDGEWREGAESELSTTRMAA
jgi:hypothetical protein